MGNGNAMMITLHAPQAILFDLDGTLSDSMSVMKDTYKLFLNQFGITATDAEFNSLNGPPLHDVVHQLKIAHGIKGDEDALYENYGDILDDVYCSVAPCTGAQGLLQAARDNHCTIGIVTSNSATRTRTWLNAVSLSHLIDFVVSGDEVRHGKPHPEPYLAAVKQAACDVEHIIAVEDSPQGARSATQAGLKTIAIVREDEKNDAWPQGIIAVKTLEQVSKLLWIT